MRILVSGASPKEQASIRQALAGTSFGADLAVTDSMQDLGIRLKRDRAEVVLAASSAAGWDASATVRLSRQVSPGSACIGLARKGKPAEARQLVAAGALDAFPGEELWRLPLALQRVQEQGEHVHAVDRMRDLEALLEARDRLGEARRMEDIARVASRAARRLGRAEAAAFVLREGDQCHYLEEYADSPLWKGQRFPMNASIGGWAMLNKRSAFVPDTGCDDRVSAGEIPTASVRSLVMVPIGMDDPLGAIGIHWSRLRSVGEEEMALYLKLADATAQSVANLRGKAELERRIRERAASLEAVNKELEGFARSVSHDLRSPLAVIVGYADLLADEGRVDLAKSDRAKVIDIRAAAMRMNALIDDMLSLSQVIQREVAPRRVDLSALAEDILSRLSVAEPGRQVEARVQPGLWLIGDAGLMRIAIGNLLSNAWKYSSKRATAHIEVGRTEVPGKGPAFYVRDDGAGFDMAQVRRLFKPFQRLHSLSDFPGSGIGLATVHRVLEKHGGTIWVEAEKGKGSTFFFELPGPGGLAPESLAYEDAAGPGR